MQLLKCTQALKQNVSIAEDKSYPSTLPLSSSSSSPSTTLVEKNGVDQTVEPMASLPVSSIVACESCTGENAPMAINALRLHVRDLNALLSSTQTERDTLLRA